MRTLSLGLGLCCLVAVVGCGNSSPPGGPGVTTNPSQPASSPKAEATPDKGHARVATDEPTSDIHPSADVVDKDNTFTLSTPLLATSLKQGEKKEVEISISRGKAFTQDVDLKFDAPKGVKVDADAKAIKAAEKSVKVFVAADKDAPLGEQDVKVTGTPKTGAATSVMLKVKVTKD